MEEKGPKADSSEHPRSLRAKEKVEGKGPKVDTSEHPRSLRAKEKVEGYGPTVDTSEHPRSLRAKGKGPKANTLKATEGARQTIIIQKRHGL